MKLTNEELHQAITQAFTIINKAVPLSEEKMIAERQFKALMAEQLRRALMQ